MPASLHIPDFSRAQVLVAGDIMLDRYWYGTTCRISPEAPVPVVRVEEEELRPGGAANVALNIATLGGQVLLLGLVGNDEQGQALERSLLQRQVKCCLERALGVPTITKLRVISRHQQLLRMDFENGFPESTARRLLETYRQHLGQVELVVISDYAKGTLCDSREMVRLARANGRMVLVDPKQRDFAAYHGATVVTPNIAEFEAVVGTCSTETIMVERGLNLLACHQFDALLITRGEKGMSLIQARESPRHLPTHAREVYDVTGAGDTVISVLAAGLAAGLPLLQATQLANHAAGIVVGKLGTAAVSVAELHRAIEGWGCGVSPHLGDWIPRHGMVSEAELLELVQAAKGRGESITFTNGCFDILHAGHVTYLEEASRLGNRLIVAVNVDQTVRALKGQDRPINTIGQRMQVLAALACVDWVVSFDEPTPERLISILQPDFLVKGGDNDPDQIPGAACVRQYGGQVLTLSYLADHSTTGVVKRIRAN